MINTLIKSDKAKKQELESLFNKMCFVPQWEKIAEVALNKKGFFRRTAINAGLFRKFSSKNMLEKYSLRINDSQVIAFMDLKVYKDCVYIINLDSDSFSLYNESICDLLQIAIEKALYNTTDKEVKINLSLPLIKNNRMKKILINSGFVSEANQTNYEKEMFGETFSISVEKSDMWRRRIKQKSFLINK